MVRAGRLHPGGQQWTDINSLEEEDGQGSAENGEDSWGGGEEWGGRSAGGKLQGEHQCRTASCWRQAQDLDKGGGGEDNSSDAEGDQL